MRRFARQLRRPAVLLAGFYLAGVGLLAGILGPQPAAEVRIRLDGDRYYELLGISPDGNTIATQQDWVGPGRTSIDPTKPATTWLWDLTAAGGRGARPSVTLDSPFERGIQSWMGHQPGWQHLFWDIVLAPDPYQERDRLLGSHGRYVSEAWLSADGRWLVRFGWPHEPNIGPPQPGPVYFVHEQGTRLRSFQLPHGEEPVAVRTDAVLVTQERVRENAFVIKPEKSSQQSASVTVRHRSLPDGRELSRLILAGAKEIPDEQPFDGRWLVAGSDPGRVNWRWKLGQQWLYDAKTGERHWDISGEGIRRFARGGKTLIRTNDDNNNNLLGELQFFDVESRTQTRAYRPYICEFEGISPDGDTVAVTSYHDSDRMITRWPWLNGVLLRFGLISDKQSYELTLLDAATGEVRARLPGGSSTADDCPQHAVFSADSKRLAVISGDCIVRVWDLPIRTPWVRVLALAAVPPALIGLSIAAIRSLHRHRRPRSEVARAV